MYTWIVEILNILLCIASREAERDLLTKFVEVDFFFLWELIFLKRLRNVDFKIVAQSEAFVDETLS